MNEDKSKSVLDSYPVINHAFKSFPDYTAEPAPTFAINQPNLSVVSSCPKCGAPIYGPKEAKADSAVQVQRTCSCVYQLGAGRCNMIGQQKDIKDHMRTS